VIRKIDLLITKELIGPWIFGVAMFTSLLMAATYLGRLAGFIVDGAPLGMVLEITALYVPALAVKTFCMAMLLSGLLAFGRLSSDSEIVALRAGGASLVRIVAPVMGFSLVVALLTFVFNEMVVPVAGKESVRLANQIAHTQSKGAANPQVFPYYSDNKLLMSVSAQNVDTAKMELRGVGIVAFGDDGMPSGVMSAPVVRSSDVKNPKNWLIPDGAHFTSLREPRADADVKGQIWPGQMPKLDVSFKDLITLKDDDFDAYSMSELRRRIEMHRAKRDIAPKDLANSEYGYWNKIALPLAALIFGTLGSVLGIRNHRTGTATGFALAVAIIFGYFMLLNFMNVWAEGFVIPPWVASFTPPAIGLVASGVIMWRRNT
jgi:lipopolysaccharide export system permease protein